MDLMDLAFSARYGIPSAVNKPARDKECTHYSSITGVLEGQKSKCAVLRRFSRASSRVLLAELAPVAAAVARAVVETSLSQLYDSRWKHLSLQKQRSKQRRGSGDLEAVRPRRFDTPHHACC